MVLAYDTHYFIRSTVAVATNALVLQNDTEAIQNFVTTQPLIMLVVYNATAYHLTGEVAGKTITISIDGADQDGIGVRHDQYQAASGDKKNECTVYYLGDLPAGNHAVIGRYMANVPGNWTWISERQLAIFLFRGVAADWGFDIDTTLRTINTNVWSDDPDISVTVNLPQDNMVVLALYNASCQRFDLVGADGGEYCIQVDADAERGWHGQSTPLNTACGGTTHVIYSALVAGNHTFRGRYRANVNLQNFSIRDRQLAILIFSPTQLFDQVLDDVTAATQNRLPWVDDPGCTINRNLADTYQTLILYGAYNYEGQGMSTGGRKNAVNVDATDYSEGHQSPSAFNNKVGTTVVHALQLTAGLHTIKGCFTTNLDWDTVTISRRTMCVLYFQRQVGPSQQHLQKVMRGGL